MFQNKVLSITYFVEKGPIYYIKEKAGEIPFNSSPQLFYDYNTCSKFISKIVSEILMFSLVNFQENYLYQLLQLNACLILFVNYLEVLH